MSPGEPWGNLGGTLGAGRKDFLKDFFKDVRGTLGDIDVPGDIGDIDLGEPWGLGNKIFLRISSGMSPGEPWGNLGGTLGAGQQDFLKDFFKDVPGEPWGQRGHPGELFARLGHKHRFPS